MQLKTWVLSGVAVVLWLAPLTALDKKVGWHKSIQGISLCIATACAFTAGNIARELSGQQEIEKIKTRAITADVVDEIATSAYISQQQRRQEAETLLNESSERSRTIELLERALSLEVAKEPNAEPTEPSERSLLENSSGTPEGERSLSSFTPEEQVLAERIMNLKVRGWGKAKIILQIWGVTKGGSEKYKAAEAEYRRLVGSANQ